MKTLLIINIILTIGLYMWVTKAYKHIMTHMHDISIEDLRMIKMMLKGSE